MNDLNAFVLMLTNAGIDFSKTCLSSGDIDVFLTGKQIVATFRSDYTMKSLIHLS